MTACSAVIECKHTSNEKIATFAPSLCFSLSLFAPICILIYFEFVFMSIQSFWGALTTNR